MPPFSSEATGLGEVKTRDCIDPWTYLEVTASGGLKPCCNIPALKQMDSSPESALAATSSAEFRALRRGLLSGDLHPICQKCHARKRVPLAVLHERVSALQETEELADPLEPAAPASLRIDINELCNLRCDYCAVTHPTYVGQEMSPDLFPAVVELARQMAPGGIVHINGHGETTYHPRWMEAGRQVLAAGHRPRITSNLAKRFTDEEIDILAQFGQIMVSLDSDDDRMMRKIRKAVSIGHIFATIDRIRASAARQSMAPPPVLAFSVGVYDPSIWTLESFVERLLGFAPGLFHFWNLVEYSHQKQVRALRTLDEEATAKARGILARTRAMLVASNVEHVFLGDFDGAGGQPLV